MAKLRQKLPTDDSLAAIGREWLALMSPGWSDTHTERDTRNLEKDLTPWLGRRRISEIEAQELLATVRKVEERGALESAHRVLGTARAIWAYAIATGRTRRNVASDLRGALKPHKARWQEFDLDAALWTVPAARQKRDKHGKENGPPHVVPLPRQAVVILRELHRLTGSGPEAWVFPGMRPGKPFSENTVNAALHTLGFRAFRPGTDSAPRPAPFWMRCWA